MWWDWIFFLRRGPLFLRGFFAGLWVCLSMLRRPLCHPPPMFSGGVLGGGTSSVWRIFPFVVAFFGLRRFLSRWWICPKGPHCPMRRRSGGGGARAKPRYVAAHPPDGHSVVLLWFCTLVGLPLRRPKALRSFYFGQQVYI